MDLDVKKKLRKENMASIVVPEPPLM